MYETAAVYCVSNEGVDPNNPSSAAQLVPRVPHDGDALNWELEEGYYLSCRWQNVPTDDAYGNLLIAKRLCPEGYTFGSKPLEDLLDECSEHHTGVQIELAYESGETAQASTVQQQGSAVAAFLEQPSGNLMVRETGPVGYFLGRVYCTRNEITSGTTLTDLSSYDQENVTDNGFPARIDPGYDVSCFLFNVPGEAGVAAREAGSVLVYKWLCPPGFAATNPGIGGFPAIAHRKAASSFRRPLLRL